MDVKVCGKTKRTLGMDGDIYLSQSMDKETGLLYFRVDWLKNMARVRSPRFKIVVTCGEPVEYKFLDVEDEKIEHGIASISCEAIKSDTIKFIPFNLYKRIQPVQAEATFSIELQELTGEMIVSASVTLSTENII